MKDTGGMRGQSKEHVVTTLSKVIYRNPSSSKKLTKKSGIRTLKPGPVQATGIVN